MYSYRTILEEIFGVLFAIGELALLPTFSSPCVRVDTIGEKNAEKCTLIVKKFQISFEKS